MHVTQTAKKEEERPEITFFVITVFCVCVCMTSNKVWEKVDSWLGFILLPNPSHYINHWGYLWLCQKSCMCDTIQGIYATRRHFMVHTTFTMVIVNWFDCLNLFFHVCILHDFCDCSQKKIFFFLFYCTDNEANESKSGDEFEIN